MGEGGVGVCRWVSDWLRLYSVGRATQTNSTAPTTNTYMDVANQSFQSVKPDDDDEDDSWFDEERKQLEEKYRQILQDLKSQIGDQRKEDPDGVPENAEGVVESVVKQEMDRMISSVKMTRAKERLQEEEVRRMSDLNAKYIRSYIVRI